MCLVEENLQQGWRIRARDFIWKRGALKRSVGAIHKDPVGELWTDANLSEFLRNSVYFLPMSKMLCPYCKRVTCECDSDDSASGDDYPDE